MSRLPSPQRRIYLTNPVGSQVRSVPCGSVPRSDIGVRLSILSRNANRRAASEGSVHRRRRRRPAWSIPTAGAWPGWPRRRRNPAVSPPDGTPPPMSPGRHRPANRRGIRSGNPGERFLGAGRLRGRPGAGSAGVAAAGADAAASRAAAFGTVPRVLARELAWEVPIRYCETKLCTSQ